MVNPMRVRDAIEHNLTEALRPRRLEIEDESHRHAGHAGARPEGESHFRLTVVADSFAGKSRLERQRMVHAALKDLMASQIHALSLSTLSPDEDTQRPV
ncbi:MAG: BolA family protein [Pseudomonadota bacterium]